MGVVYRAVDERLNRTVALKVIASGTADGERRRRFLKEARAACSFTHPNVVTIHEVDTAGEIDFIVMELVSGRSLDKRIQPKGLPIDEAISIGEQVASALAAAHAAGIVHRDIKPANVVVTDSGHVKLLDFGIAKQLAGPVGADAATLTVADQTRSGSVLGSVPYMSPEQAQGHAIDGRSDVFGFGILLYEALTGRRPFGGTTSLETVAKILEATPPAVEGIRADVPLALASLVSACLEKDRNRRPQSSDVHAQLSALRRSRSASAMPISALFTRKAVVVPALVVLMVAAGTGWWWWESGAALRDARRRLPAVLELAAKDDSFAFYPQAFELMKAIPDDPQLREAWRRLTITPPPLKSDPSGAEVLVKGYTSPDDGWVSLGRTPIDAPRFPAGGLVRLRFVKDGYATSEGTMTVSRLNQHLDPPASVPDGMVRVPAGTVSIDGIQSQVSDFWLARHEVTNREFKTFVDAGGYVKRDYWKEPFVENGHTLTWEEAMTRFHDQTRRPGPSTWELGSFPSGEADMPVGGISWYEAAAFARFAGKSLPTAYQWRIAADFLGPSGIFGDILLNSTFNAKGPTRVGTLNNIGPYGQYDMAGNVKEWCWNEARGGRVILGGGWNEPKYMYQDRDAQPAFSRAVTHGMRLAQDITAQPQSSYAFVAAAARDYEVEKPIGDDAFAIVKGLYTYDPRPLNDRIEKSEEVPDWRHETITFDAAYGNERVILHLYLPKSAPPPHQTIVYFPGGDAPMLRSSLELNLSNVDFLIRSGRAIAYPVYSGTYERAVTPSRPKTGREVTIERVKDFGRVVDYISTRRDLDADRLGYYGVSLGANVGAIINAIDPRIKANVFLGGGLLRSKVPPEMDTLNFATRMRAPTLMVSGASDFQYPLEGTQRPLFRLLPMPPDRKRHALFDGGHVPNQIHDVMREMLDWFDKFLGPVKTAASAGSN